MKSLAEQLLDLHKKGVRFPESKKVQGQVLWKSERDGNGIIVDGDASTGSKGKKEFYFDSSTAKDTFDKLKPQMDVEFDSVVLKPDNILTARNIKIL